MNERWAQRTAMLAELGRRKVATKEELLGLAGCSAMTLWRALSGSGYLTSFNRNARYYTLATVPEFDAQGLWFHRGIGFSRYGSLPATVQGLVADSAAGQTSVELTARLTVKVAPMLCRLYAAGQVARAKEGRGFVYLAVGAERRAAQLAARAAQLARSRLPSPEVVIAVLMELVERVALGPEEVACRLGRRGLTATAAEVAAVFHHYDLAEQKKGR